MRPTSKSSPLALIATFLLGACTTVALQSSATSEGMDTTAPTEAGEAGDAGEPGAIEATVIPLDEAPEATAPNGKASITHLALGHNAYIGRLRMDGGGAVPVHRDPTEEYIHVLSGGGTMTIDGEEYEISAGTTIFMPANAEVSYQNGDEEMVALQVFAGPEPAAKYDSWAAVD